MRGKKWLTTIFYSVTSSLQASAAAVNGTTPIVLDKADSPSQTSAVNSRYSWLECVSIGIALVKLRYPNARLIDVDNFVIEPGQAFSPEELNQFTVLNDEPRQGTIALEGTGGPTIIWGEPRLQGDHVFHRNPEMDWPPPFDIYTADRLSKQAGYAWPYESIRVTIDRYEFFTSWTGRQWEVLYNGSVRPIEEQRHVESNPANTS